MAKISPQQISSILSQPATDPECYSGTSVFINLPAITDSKELRTVEASYSAIRELELMGGSVSFPLTFDFDHLRIIHWYLFQDVYAWAGAIRSYPMRKSGDEFADPKDFGKWSGLYFGEIAEDNYLQGCSEPDYVAKRIAYYLGTINLIHPFPEGNGRVQRLFLSQLLLNTPFMVDWHNFSSFMMIHCCQNIIRQQPTFEERFEGMERNIREHLVLRSQ